MNNYFYDFPKRYSALFIVFQLFSLQVLITSGVIVLECVWLNGFSNGDIIKDYLSDPRDQSSKLT